MALEIERKFLVLETLHALPLPEWGPGEPIRQGYLARGSNATARVRTIGETGWLTIKGKTVGISRAEFEYQIPFEEARALLALCEGGLIEKVRWRVPHQGHVWEVDRFEGDNAGLMVAEIELTSEDEMFARPAWVGEEVSDDPRYFNGALSRHPYRAWR